MQGKKFCRVGVLDIRLKPSVLLELLTDVDNSTLFADLIRHLEPVCDCPVDNLFKLHEIVLSLLTTSRVVQVRRDSAEQALKHVKGRLTG